MSMKVYSAYKVTDPKNIWEITKLIQTQGEVNAKETLRKYYIDQVRRMDPDTKEYKEAREKYRTAADANEANFRLWHAHNLLKSGYKESLGSMSMSPYNLD